MNTDYKYTEFEFTFMTDKGRVIKGQGVEFGPDFKKKKTVPILEFMEGKNENTMR